MRIPTRAANTEERIQATRRTASPCTPIMSARSGLSTTALVEVPKRVRRSSAHSSAAIDKETSRVPSWS